MGQWKWQKDVEQIKIMAGSEETSVQLQTEEKQGPMRNRLAIYPRDVWALSWVPASAISSSLPGTINSPTRLFDFYFIC